MLQREQVLRQLSAACADGRITPRELAARAVAAQVAITIAACGASPGTCPARLRHRAAQGASSPPLAIRRWPPE